MLPVFIVGTVVCFTIVYTLLKVRIQEWIDEPKMSRLSLKKNRFDKELSVNTQEPTFTISDDESDPEREREEDKSSNKNVPSLIKSIVGHEKDSKLATMPSHSLPTKKTSLFGWDRVVQKTPVFIDDDSSDDEYRILSINSPSYSNNVKIEEEETFNEEKAFDTSDSEDKRPSPEKKVKTNNCYNTCSKKCATNKMESPKKKMYGAGSSTDTNVFDMDTDLDDTLDYDQETLEPSKFNETKSHPEVTIRKTYTVSGIEVKLPVNPYPCQTAVISKIIQACNTERNCLLESPTGSGKTLALLCGVLAWQDHYTKKVSKEQEELGKSYHYRPPNGKAEASKRKEFEKNFDPENDETCTERVKVPRVYYGTRTHKQIEQVVRELKKTVYRDKRMTILSSREHTCIQSTDRNKTELCSELLDPLKNRGCPFYNKDYHQRPLSSHENLARNGLETPWDIEDFVAVGQELHTCPYFSARDLKESAEIIFCPYNYLIDPDIRESMDINLANEIIVLDEAHNMEDTCREVASKDFRQDHLLLAADDCMSISKVRKENLIANGFQHSYKNLANYFTALVDFFKLQKVKSVNVNSERASSDCWTGEQFEALLKMPTVRPLGDFGMFNAAAGAVLLDYKNEKEDITRDPARSQQKRWPIISDSTRRVVEELSYCLHMISSPAFRNDYRLCVVENVVKDAVKPTGDDSWIRARRTTDRIRILQLMCMNPGVIFTPIAKSTRSIILASGTLSPTSSFGSELGTEFFYTLSAAHVIPRERVYVRCVPKGPTGKVLKATFQNINQWTFQEELGRLVLNVCETVPHGILCFFSSYNTLNSHIKRWQDTQDNIWGQIEKRKVVFTEPRYSGHLAEVMQEYRDTIKSTLDGPKDSITGAIFFAVFRGKVAEGIDFSDDEARCVLAVGIPYAVRKDPAVDMKFAYNDQHHHTKGLLKGGEWYAVQAFRALNQALGRCVRHQNDWGAVLLVDERFQLQDNVKYLPKWIQLMIRQNVNYNLQEELEVFVSNLKGNSN